MYTVSESSSQFRRVPDEYEQIKNAWYHWRAVWNGVHYTLGSAAAFLSIIVAANAGSAAANAGATLPAAAKGFLTPVETVVVAGVAAVLSFLLTITKPSEKSQGYQNAGRRMEAAIAKFEGGTVGIDFLAEAKEEAIKMLP